MKTLFKLYEKNKLEMWDCKKLPCLKFMYLGSGHIMKLDTMADKALKMADNFLLRNYE